MAGVPHVPPPPARLGYTARSTVPAGVPRPRPFTSTPSAGCPSSRITSASRASVVASPIPHVCPGEPPLSSPPAHSTADSKTISLLPHRMRNAAVSHDSGAGRSTGTLWTATSTSPPANSAGRKVITERGRAPVVRHLKHGARSIRPYAGAYEPSLPSSPGRISIGAEAAALRTTPSRCSRVTPPSNPPTASQSGCTCHMASVMASVPPEKWSTTNQPTPCSARTPRVCAMGAYASCLPSM